VGTHTIEVTFESESPDLNPANNVLHVPLRVVPVPPDIDLALTQVIHAASGSVGKPITITATLRNKSDIPASGVRLSASFFGVPVRIDRIPDGCPPEEGLDRRQCDLGGLAPGEERTVEFVVVPLARGVLTSSFLLESNQTEVAYRDNSSYQRVSIEVPPTLTVYVIGSNQVSLVYYLPTEGPVRLDVFDVRGRRLDTIVDTIVDGNVRLPEMHFRTWTAPSSAVYFFRLRTPAGEHAVHTFVLP
jgi:hypothetical protein